MNAHVLTLTHQILYILFMKMDDIIFIGSNDVGMALNHITVRKNKFLLVKCVSGIFTPMNTH